MARARRIDVPDGRYHVVARGVDRGRIFFADADRKEFGRLLGDIHQRFGLRVLAYCLMDNHYHLVMHAPNGGLSTGMQHLGGTFARHVNERVGRDGHLFGARFFSRLITTDAYLLTAIRYVERNSLDLPGVTSPDQHRWSSYRANAGLKNGPAWLDSLAVRSYFDSTSRYRRFIEDHPPRSLTREIEMPLLDHFVDLAIVLHRPDSITPQHLDRTVKLSLVERVSSTDRERILEHLGLEDRDSVAHALRHAAVRLERHPQIGPVVDAALRMLVDATGRMGQAQPSGGGVEAA